MRKKIVSTVARILGVTIYIDEVRCGAMPKHEAFDTCQLAEPKMKVDA